MLIGEFNRSDVREEREIRREEVAVMQEGGMKYGRKERR
jgi:hypothetical protein